jgi:putative acetyltransferase
MISTRRTSSNDSVFHQLVSALDKDLADRYGTLQQFYDQYNKIENLATVVIAFVNDKPAGCACFKYFEDGAVELKRMYVAPLYRGHGIGATLLAELEKWAAELGYRSLVLELGNQQPEAFQLYQKQGFRVIPNYGQYTGMDTSICMKKQITSRL